MARVLVMVRVMVMVMVRVRVRAVTSIAPHEEATIL